MDNQSLVEQAKERARSNLKEKGLGSRATVVNTIWELLETDIPPEVVVKVNGALEGFFAGTGLMGSACGFLALCLGTIGMIYGGKGLVYDGSSPGWGVEAFQGSLGQLLRDTELPPEEKAQKYLDMIKPFAIYNQMTNRFKKRFGSINCLDLIRPWATDPITIDWFRNCETIIVETTGIAMELILEARENGLSSFEIEGNMFATLFPNLRGE